MVRVLPLLLIDIEAAIRESWSSETADPEVRGQWTSANPEQGQCAATAQVLNDLIGGYLLRGEVHLDGQRIDVHWWNQLKVGVEIDLTRSQFVAGEQIVPDDGPARLPDEYLQRLRSQYQLLRERVLTRLSEPANRHP